MCNIDYEHTQSTKAGAPGVDPGQLITESRLFPQRQTDVATGAPCCDRKVNADRVLFGRKHRLKCCQNRGIEPTQGRGVRTTPASTRGHMWMGARTRTHELFGAIRSYSLQATRAARLDCARGRRAVLGGGSMRRCGRRAFQHVVRPPARRFLGLWGWAGGGGHGGLWVLAAVCGNGLEITF